MHNLLNVLLLIFNDKCCLYLLSEVFAFCGLVRLLFLAHVIFAAGLCFCPCVCWLVCLSAGSDCRITAKLRDEFL